MTRANIVLLIGIIALISGCGENTIDTSSEESMQESITRIKESLPPEKQEAFEKALITVTMGGDNLFEIASTPGGAERLMKERLDGKTAEEVFAEAEKVKAEVAERQAQRAERQAQFEAEVAAQEEELEKQLREHQIDQLKGLLEEVRGKIIDLEKKQEVAKTAREKLKEFTVERSRFYRYTEGFRRGDPVIELTVQNNLSEPVSRAYFRGVLATPSRSVPWVDDTFNYSIRGGLEPGEKATWKLSPNMFGEWSSAPRDRDDMVLTVTVVRVDGADEEPLFDAEFDDREMDRLLRLTQQENKIREQLADLQANGSVTSE